MAARTKNPSGQGRRAKRAPEAAPLAYLDSSVPGRARLRVPMHRRDKAFFADLADRLLAVEGVYEVEANPLTAGVLVRHKGELEVVIASLRAQGVLRLDLPPQRRGLRERVVERMDGIDDALLAGTRAEVDLGALAFLVFALTGLFQLARGQVAPPAISAFWYAANAALMARRGAGAVKTDPD